MLPSRLASLGLVFLLCATRIEADWVQGESRAEPSIATGLIHQHLVMEDSASGTRATMELARFSPKKFQLRPVDNPGARNLADAIDSGTYLAATNGGYFDENFAPLGLRIIDGKTFSPLARGRLMTGVIVSAGSTVKILRLNEFRRNGGLSAALQCGPFLVDQGRTVPRLNATRPARRTFVAVTNSEVILGFCSSVSLAQLSSVLAGQNGDWKIQRALNLDGGSSSAFWFKRKDGSAFSISEHKNVRDFIAVVAK